MKTFEVDRVPIKGKHMERDMSSKAVVSTDMEGLRAYKDKKRIMEATTLETKALREEINTIKQTLEEIKELLRKT